MKGRTGKILLLELDERRTSIIPTSDYEQWVGGHGLGSALFWDLCADKQADGFDPANVVTIMTSPLTGTLAPGGASRTEVQGIGVQSSPVCWFTRSNLGGRFGAMLKYAGWDGVVVRGRADAPVWVDIRNDEVSIRDGRDLWGLDTWQAQQKIMEQVTGKRGAWADVTNGRTTQRPAVLAIGPAGERRSRLGALIHDAGNAAGQGGFGGIFGAKNLKAISVIGTGSISVHDPQGLMEARRWAVKNYSLDLTDPRDLANSKSLFGLLKLRSLSSFGTAAVPVLFWRQPKKLRPQACVGCPAGCRSRTDSGGNESSCADTAVYVPYDIRKNSRGILKKLAAYAGKRGGEFGAVGISLLFGKAMTASYHATDLAQRYGINAFELFRGFSWLMDLYKMGELGPGCTIDTDLDFGEMGTVDFADRLFHAIAFREGIGDDLAEGFYRAAGKWGRQEEDLKSGILAYAYWGLPDHYDPRFQTEWGYGSALGDRDINEHGFNILFWMPTVTGMLGKKPFVTAEQAARIFGDKMALGGAPGVEIDYSEAGAYSENMARLVSWHRGYTRFWKQSALFCDYLFPDVFNAASDHLSGMTGEAEPKFLKAVTGQDLDFAEGVELGKKIWNLDHAVWTLQGRHRDQVGFADYVHDQPLPIPALLPQKVEGKWEYVSMAGRKVDREKFEDWKTIFYKLEGWDPTTGRPTRRALETHGLARVADELADQGCLGGES